MKRLILTGFLGLAAAAGMASAETQQYVRFTSPSAGAAIRQSVDVAWTSAGFSGAPVAVEAAADGSVFRTIAIVPIEAGRVPWDTTLWSDSDDYVLRLRVLTQPGRGASLGGVVVDNTAPDIAFVGKTPAANANGWNKTAVELEWSCADVTSGAVDASPTVTLSTEGAAQFATGECEDEAGNVARNTAGPVSIDLTAPTVNVSATGTANAAGWRNAPFDASWSGNDSLSGVLPGGCSAPVTYSGPDTAAGSLTGSCTDRAGNSASATLSFAYDATAPGILLASRLPAANAHGWNNAAVTATWSCSDATSGVVQSPVTQTRSAQGADQGATGTCADNAGNTSTHTVSGISIDTTAPTVTGTLAPAPQGTGGWYTAPATLAWSGDDALSGLDGACAGPAAYAGPDTTGTPLNGSCVDKAGNTGSGSVTIKYDATDPSISAGTASPAANAAGWNNGDVTVTWSCSDATSGALAPSVSQTITGEGAGLSATGTCTDGAGNTAENVHGGVDIDRTDPTITFLSRAPDAEWVNTDVTVTWSCADALSGPAAAAAVDVVTGEGDALTAEGTCADLAGNDASDTQGPIGIDRTKPTATVGADRPADSNGWYNAPLTATWTGEDALSGVAACAAPAVYSGPDTAAGLVSGTCTDEAGNVSDAAALTFKYDATAPVASATPDRAPDANGWYNDALTITWGADATSGADDCSNEYAGPDTGAATLTGTCTDLAGNESAPSTLTFKFDATAPTAALLCPPAWHRGVPVQTGLFGTLSDDVSGPESVSATANGAPLAITELIGFTPEDDTWAWMASLRLPSGTYTISSTATDVAGNESTSTCSVTVTG